MPWVLRMILTIFPLVALLHFYGYKRLSGSLMNRYPQAGKPIRRGLRLLFVWFLLLPVAMFFATQFRWTAFRDTLNNGHPISDFLIVFPFWFGLLFSAELFPLLLLLDLAKWVLRRARPAAAVTWQKLHFKGVLLAAAFFALFIPLRIAADLELNRVFETNYENENLPAAFNQFRIVHISDLQADPRTETARMRSYIDRINALRPDLVIFTGDLVTRQKRYIRPGAKMLAQIKAKYGVYACLGDHDYWSDAALVRSAQLEEGIGFLEDSTAVLHVGDATLELTGVTNIYNHRGSLDRIEGLANNGGSSTLKIVFLHQPSRMIVEMAQRDGFNILLGGHTHGGQVVLWNWLFALTPARLETPFWRGFHNAGSMLISINNGLGLTLAPVRYQAPASVNLITITTPPIIAPAAP